MKDFQALLDDASVCAARRMLHDTDDLTLREQTGLAGIPAPSLQEAERGDWVRCRFAELGLCGIATDEAGNVLARLPGGGEGAPLIASAHLDTVFPAGTPLDISRSEGRICAPGIGDNARGLAALLAIARVMTACRVQLPCPLLFVATVGEEGAGDLAGVKYLFRESSPLLASRGFVSIDGVGSARIVHRAVGSRRLRLAISGAGGHSWADFGTANPLHALGSAVAGMAALELPQQPLTTLSVTRAGGGLSINSIPASAWWEVDIRSEDAASLSAREKDARDRAREAVQSENERRRAGTEPLGLEVSVIGDRPAGATAADTPLVRAAVMATEMLGSVPELIASSTDANVPMALGIPAITLGAGGSAGRIHTRAEWYENDGGARGIERILLTILAAAHADPSR